MPSHMLLAGHETKLESDSPATESDLRRAYFAQSGEFIVRYGVSFERVLEHLEEARTHHSRSSAPGIRNIDDLVHAVACVDGLDLAWWDLTEEYERALVRACGQLLEPADAIIFVRRLLADLRREVGGVLSLRTFDGSCSLRRWLGDRIMGRMNRSGAEFHFNRRPALDQPPLLEGHIIAGDVIWRRTADPRPDDDRPRIRPRRQA